MKRLVWRLRLSRTDNPGKGNCQIKCWSLHFYTHPHKWLKQAMHAESPLDYLGRAKVL